MSTTQGLSQVKRGVRERKRTPEEEVRLLVDERWYIDQDHFFDLWLDIALKIKRCAGQPALSAEWECGRSPVLLKLKFVLLERCSTGLLFDSVGQKTLSLPGFKVFEWIREGKKSPWKHYPYWGTISEDSSVDQWSLPWEEYEPTDNPMLMADSFDYKKPERLEKIYIGYSDTMSVLENICSKDYTVNHRQIMDRTFSELWK